MFRALLLTFIMLSVTASHVHAQVRTDTTRYRVETKDGNAFQGTIIETDSVHIRVSTERLGVVTILQEDIKSITKLESTAVVNGKYWYRNLQSTRYLWAPNGYGLKKGETYYQNVWVLFNQISTGISDYVSFGIGMIPLFLFNGTSTPAWITPKVSIPIHRDKINIGTGALLGTVLGESSSAGFGLAYGIATFGSRDANLSIGLGYGFAGGEWSQTPTVTISGIRRVSERTYLISENYYLDFGYGDKFALASFGGRSLLKGVGIDYAAVMPLGTGGGFYALPWLGITVPIRNKLGNQQ